MAEYIEREAFKAEIRRLSTHYLNEWNTLGVLAAVDRVPAADVREVKKGKWIHSGEIMYCNKCQYIAMRTHNFCPNCGARMVNDDV